MHHLLRIGSIALCFAVASGTLRAQDPVRIETKKGLTITKDSTFKMTIRFRMQNRFALFSEDGDDLNVGSSDIRVRRMRLRLDGFLITPKMQYKVQLGFSKADLDLVESTTAQPIRDAVLYYTPAVHWTFGIGQTKLPGNRQRVVSSGALQLPDRSIVNALFTLDRDMGLFGTFKAAITTGEGRNANPGDEGLCYTGRVEWMPLGTFTNEGDYFEGDLEREPKPKVSLAAGYSTNQHARRAGGHFTDEARLLVVQPSNRIRRQRPEREFITEPQVRVGGFQQRQQLPGAVLPEKVVVKFDAAQLPGMF